MDTLEKEKRLKERLEHNIRNEEIGTAIAITGSWGVGKTFFWKRCIDGYHFKKKYVYVSLFGLESLSDLKTHIYSNIENNHSTLEIPRWIRGLPSILKDTRVSQFGLNASTKIFDSLMFNQVKDAIICFDDFERMSNKLDIKDVMGLANYLKLEKNCQVILILDEDKAEGDNKQKYADYKEKLVDETIIINSVEPLIRGNTKDFDDQLVDLMVEFANKLEIHNFRFFQKVIKLYREFRCFLQPTVADSTKEIILVRILQGFFIIDFGGTYGITWEDFTTKNSVRNLINEKYHPEKAKSENVILGKLNKVSYLFVKDDLWSIEFRKWFEQKDGVNFQKLEELATSELISEEQNQIRMEIRQLMLQWRNIEIDKNFCGRLHLLAFKSIGVESLENLDFCRILLSKFGRTDLSKHLKIKIKEWINIEIQTKGKSFASDTFSFGYHEKNIFHRYIRVLAKQNPLAGLPSLIEVVKRYVIHDIYNSETSAIVLEQAAKEDWRKLLFVVFNEDGDFKEISRLELIKKIIRQPIKSELNPKIRQEILEILQEKAEESEILKLNVDYLITRLDD